MLWPEVIDAVAPIPVLAAGGIGTGRQIAAALAMGARGRMDRFDLADRAGGRAPPAQMEQLLERHSRDTVRSRSFTGKPAAC